LGQAYQPVDFASIAFLVRKTDGELLLFSLDGFRAGGARCRQ
jgi:hypothetical protein